MNTLKLMALILLMAGSAEGATSVTMDWTATGDDGNVGTATSQELRWSSTVPDTTGYAAWLASGANAATAPSGISSWWNVVSRVTLPVPKPAGTAETYTLNATFTDGATYYFMLGVCDEAGHCVRSNFSTKTFPIPDTSPPSAITDLRAR